MPQVTTRPRGSAMPTAWASLRGARAVDAPRPDCSRYGLAARGDGARPASPPSRTPPAARGLAHRWAGHLEHFCKQSGIVLAPLATSIFRPLTLLA